MPQRQFFIQLFLISSLTAALLFWLNTLPKFQADSGFTWFSLALFVVLSIIMFFVGRKASLSDNKNTFTNTALLFTTAKLFLTVIIIYSYNEIMEPKSRLFILPFFAVYLIFTIFETYFMIRLGRIEGKA